VPFCNSIFLVCQEQTFLSAPKALDKSKAYPCQMLITRRERSLELAVVTPHHASREASGDVGEQPQTYLWLPLRAAHKSLLITGRPYLVKWATDQIPRRATRSSLSTIQACLPLSCEQTCVSNRRVLVLVTVTPLKPPPYTPGSAHHDPPLRLLVVPDTPSWRGLN
jgi:hypothetical protein